MIFDLQKKCEESTESPHVLHTHFPLTVPFISGRYIFTSMNLRSFFFSSLPKGIFNWFLEREEGGRERERERERSIGCLCMWPTAGDQTRPQVCALTRNQTLSRLVHGTMLWPRLHVLFSKIIILIAITEKNPNCVSVWNRYINRGVFIHWIRASKIDTVE